MSPVDRVAANLGRRLLAAHWLALVVTSLALLFLFAEVTEEVIERHTAVIDDPVRSWVLAHRTPAGERFFWILTQFGSAAATLAIGTAAAAWLWVRAKRPIAAVFASAPAAAASLFVAIKHLVERQRPAGGAAMLALATYSFPSGHATATTALWVTLMYLLWRERLVSLRLACLLGLGWPLLVGFSRVYLDLHWATDVLGGWLLGLGLAIAAAAVSEWWRSRQVPLDGGSRGTSR